MNATLWNKIRYTIYLSFYDLVVMSFDHLRGNFRIIILRKP